MNHQANDAQHYQYYILDYPTAPINEQYYFVVKQYDSHKLITLSAYDLLYNRPDILSSLTPEEVKKIQYYFRLPILAEIAS